jgi:hypothetical protein
MSEENQIRIKIALREPDEDSRLDKLSNIAVEVRKGQQDLSSEDLTILYRALLHETDPMIYTAIWDILELGAPLPELQSIALRMLSQPSALCRGQAMTYLLNNYSELRAELLEMYQAEEDAYVHDAAARFLVATEPGKALALWYRVLELPDLPHDLAEAVPIQIGEHAEKSDLAELDRRNWDLGGETLWGEAATFLRQRLGQSMTSRKRP